MQRNNPDYEFILYLQGLAGSNNRAALAALRRGLGRPPGEEPEMHRYVASWAGGARTRWSADAHYLVAALFAHHPLSWDDPPGQSNLGASFARLWNANGVSPEGVEQRFINLLGVEGEDLPHHLRHTISLLKSHDVPVDWSQLLNDLIWWGSDDRPVQRRWARAFWQDTAPAEDNENSDT